ncbi:hypothetical protein Tco_0750977 [Tanacetum coccineum]|uniref:MAK10-like protein n=1 Tax=Tanacetum coccineum TaxID=301880 RepID=A0ABQ4Z5C7_9ASTR
MDSFQGRTIDQSAGGKLRDLNPEESWAILEDLSLYDNESWNDPRDFSKPVKAIALPQDVPSTSDRRLIELENQVQRLMEAHLAPTQPTKVNKITTSCEICSGPHDTQSCMENPKQAFVEYASSRTDEAGGKWLPLSPSKTILVTPIIRHGEVTRTLGGDNLKTPEIISQTHLTGSNPTGLVSKFMASQDARLSKFEADFKQQQSEMTNKIDTVLKAITERIVGTLPSDMAHFNDAIIRPQQPEEPEPTLEDEFKDLHLNLPILEVLAHAPIYNAILDKYVEILELGKNISAFVQGETPAKMGDHGLFTLPCRLGIAKIAVGEGITRLYLMRRSLEVLRKFHWMILGGRFNQLSHVSSPLLSKPGEY